MRSLSVFILLFVVSAIIVVFSHDNSFLARAEDDLDDTEDMDVDSEDDGARVVEEEEDDDGLPKPSPHVDTTMLFVKPIVADVSTVELPSGKIVEMLVGFTNKAVNNYVVDSAETTFRYPQDYTYVIQNFSAVGYHRTVAPGHQASVYYSFMVADAFASRPFRMQVDLKYHDVKSGRQYVSAVFNETINVVELDEGLDGETFLLYVMLSAFCVLVLVAGQQLLSGGFGRRRRRGGAPAPTAERGTASNNDVDYDWIPQSTLKIATTPNSSPRQSPRLRKNRA